MKDKIIEITREIVSQLGYVCVEATILMSKNNRKLKVVIHRPGFDISTRDCAELSNILRNKLDIEVNNFSRNYDLIVESPGANRKLKNLEEVRMFMDREMEIFVKPESKIKEKKLIGKVEKIENDEINLKTEKELYKIKWSDISMARIFFDFKKYL
jgi:ribosome maturation factor RimP